LYLGLRTVLDRFETRSTVDQRFHVRPIAALASNRRAAMSLALDPEKVVMATVDMRAACGTEASPEAPIATEGELPPVQPSSSSYRE
jgi:hypothetical protein